MAKQERIYAVSFVREANNKIDHLVFHCWALNAPDAKQKAKTAWETRYQASNRRKIPHMFRLEAHRTETQDIENLRVVNWLGREIAGPDAMRMFIMTRSVTRGAYGMW